MLNGDVSAAPTTAAHLGTRKPKLCPQVTDEKQAPIGFAGFVT